MDSRTKMASATGSSESSSRAQTSTSRSAASSTQTRYRRRSRKVVFLWIVFPIITVGSMISLDELITTARSLANASRWEQATGLLDTAAARLPQDATGRAAAARLALAAAEITVDAAWHNGNGEGAARLSKLDEGGLDSDGVWDLDFTRMRCAYAATLRHPDTAVRDHAARLAASAPDPRRLGWAHMYLGLIHDNVLADRAAAPPHYEIALANSAGDDPLRREAQRHLGDHDHDRGDDPAARARWQDATAAGARAGMVGGVLSQQLLLAVLARDTGDEPGATALAAEVLRWAE